MQRFTFIVLLLAVSLSGCDFVQKINPFSKKADDSMEVYQRQQDSLKRVEALELQKQEAARQEQLRADSVRLAQEEAERARLAAEKYHIVVGSFKTPEYAESFRDKIAAQGHPSRILLTENDFHLVTIKSSGNFQSAVNEWTAVKDQGEHPEVWLYYQN